MYAGFRRRLKAFAFDYVLIFSYMLLLLMLSMFVIPTVQEWFQGSRVIAQLTGFMMLTLPVSIYFIIADSKIGKQSFGKHKINIIVTDENNQPLSVGRAVSRTFLKFLPWELSHFMVYRMIQLKEAELQLSDYFIWGLIYGLIFLSVIMVIFTKNKQTLYDWLTKTYVIK
ncbi:RDD family protein [Planococcus halocryophilus]|uniref:RDD family protein n=1 Tax=Planococcus halocryophilus TaxID=1215089 RepID=UPI001F11770F|nr:RDD family protein [Planococcus halocryophilus]MCH4826993.1 RDD family protein [Planococcus halocryophilus]